LLQLQLENPNAMTNAKDKMVFSLVLFISDSLFKKVP